MIQGILGDPVKRRWWLTVGVCVAVGILLPFVWDHTGADLKVYRLGGSMVLDDPASLYAARMRDITMPFTYPLFGAMVMVPVAVMPWPVAYGVSITVSLFAIVVIWRLCLRRLPPASSWGPAGLIAVSAASLLIEPVRETLSYGQINLILCALILYDVLEVRRPRRGIWIGIAAGIKLTPLVFFGMLVVTRQWRALAHASAAFAVTVLAGFLIAPSAAWEYWTKLLSDTARIGGLAYSGNQSWNGFLIRVTGDMDGGGLAWKAVVLLTVVAGLWLTRALWLRGERLGATAIAGMISLLCSPVSWSHHWVWMIPLGVALLTGTRVGRRFPVQTAAAWFGLLMLAPIWWVPRRGNRELDWNMLEQVAGNAYLWLALTAGLLLAAGGRTRTMPAATTIREDAPTHPRL
ncbi:glycosyltransferase 87 family protein [Kribbella italica]|uniref:Alpha-1,2-mannosyltransferase n=1 Tax=Kribbella italica TaxID=1540520 RepID=A0A7W9JF25_9ACTN|nr:alpha-1,2-mannosyltransferase [Kribbella italica]